MKKQIKISLLSLVCGLCTATFSPAFGAPAVRSLGGAGTYAGVSSASAAKTSGTSAAKSVRASAVRNTAANLGSVKSTATSSTRSAATPRLSIGKYLGGAVSVGGSTISKGEAGGELAGNVDDLQVAVERVDQFVKQLQQKIENIHNDFQTAASGDNSNFIKTTGSAGGDKFSFELDVPSLVEHVKKDLSDQLGGNVDMRYNEETGYVQYKDAQGAWVDLIAVSTKASLDEMAADLVDLENELNTLKVSGFATKEELQAVSEAIPDVSGLDSRVDDVEDMLAGDLQTQAQTIVAAINEIKAKADGALTSENLGQLNQDVSGLKDMVLGTDATDGLLDTVDALSQDMTDVSDALDGKIPVPSVACSGGSGICVLTVKGNSYEWVELELPDTPK